MDDERVTQEAPAVSAKMNSEISPDTAQAAPYLKRYTRSNPNGLTNTALEEEEKLNA